MTKILKPSIWLVLLFTSWNVFAASECDADGDVQFLCGPVSPEDLAQIPGSPWVVASGMEDDTQA